jgi:hypothetical protein
VTAPQTKTYEQKLADVIRRLASDQDGEVIASVGALKRMLASCNADLNDLASSVERLATGGLEEAEMNRLFDAGYEKGLADSRRKQAEELAVYGQRLDGSYDWLAIALFCQRENTRVRGDVERTFVNDMAARMSFPGGEPTEKQAVWLLAIFRRLGGRIEK